MSKSTKRFVAFGECMIELAPTGQANNNMHLGYAGDSYNVAYYLAQYTKNTDVYYLTALGDDPYSLKMQENFRQKGINTDYIVTIPKALPGLYLIDIDENAERHFYYYRQQAAVKQIFSEQYYQQATGELGAADYFYFSSISIAVLPEIQRQKFLSLLTTLKNTGCQIIFDSNYRPVLWHSHQQARETIEQFLPLVDIALPTFGDDALLFNDSDPKSCARRYLSHGVKEVVVKHDIKPMMLATAEGMQEVPVKPSDNLVDTTCAGDSFNGGYLAARIVHGLSALDAIASGQQVAASVIQHRGAIIDKSYLPSLFSL